MISYVTLPLSKVLIGQTHVLDQLQGVSHWELDSTRSAYLSLEPWMTKKHIQHLYGALRGLFGPHIRFGAAEQKTTARAAALYKSVPHATIVTRETADAFLSQLPISLLPGLGDRTTRFLKRHGVTTFAAFRQLSGQTLKEWFGVSGLILQQFAQGIDPRMVEPTRRLAMAM